MWSISGVVENAKNQKVFISIRGKIDSTTTNNKGEFAFKRENQSSEFVKLSLQNTVNPYLHLFADSICKIEITINDTNNISTAEIKNSKESQQLQDLANWHSTQKAKYDSLANSYNTLKQQTERIDTLCLLYIAKIDSLNEKHYGYIKKYVSKNYFTPPLQQLVL